MRTLVCVDVEYDKPVNKWVFGLLMVVLLGGAGVWAALHYAHRAQVSSASGSLPELSPSAAGTGKAEASSASRSANVALPSASKSATSPSGSPSPSADAAPTKAAPDTALERRVLYFPNNKNYGSRPDGVSEVTLTTADGLKLDAWYLKASRGQPTLVYFHGNGGNLSSLGGQFEAFRSLGLGALAVDYRGFGNSEGDPSEQGLYRDGMAAYDQAAALAGSDFLVIYGRSLGGGVASFVAVHRPCRALILESTFTSAKEVARYSHGRKGALLIDAFDTAGKLKGFDKPLLLMHGDKDTTIPYFMAEQLHQLVPQSKLFTLKGATHNNLRAKAGEEYGKQIEGFLKGVGV